MTIEIWSRRHAEEGEQWFGTDDETGEKYQATSLGALLFQIFGRMTGVMLDFEEAWEQADWNTALLEPQVEALMREDGGTNDQ
jgi:hypothetical protein